MKHIKITTLLVVTVSMFASCDFLNTSESTYYDRSELLYDPSKVTQLCTEVYSYLPHGLEGIGGAMHDAATDDAIHINNTAAIQRFCPLLQGNSRRKLLFGELSGPHF